MITAPSAVNCLPKDIWGRSDVIRSARGGRGLSRPWAIFEPRGVTIDVTTADATKRSLFNAPIISISHTTTGDATLLRSFVPVTHFLSLLLPTLPPASLYLTRVTGYLLTLGLRTFACVASFFVVHVYPSTLLSTTPSLPPVQVLHMYIPPTMMLSLGFLPTLV